MQEVNRPYGCQCEVCQLQRRVSGIVRLASFRDWGQRLRRKLLAQEQPASPIEIICRVLSRADAEFANYARN